MTAINTDWRSGWTASQPAYVGYAWAPNSGGDYRAADDGLLHRDLGLDAASDGRIGCERVRLASGQQVGDWRRLDVDFDFLYVLRGTIEIETADGQHVVLGTGGCAVQPGHTAYRYTHATSDLDAVHVTSPARYELLRGEAALAASVMPERPGVFTHDSDDQYKRGDGLGTGWHYHTMSQWFMVIGGSANISVEDHPKQPLGWGDAMCVGSGEHMRHNVTDFSSDYLVLEMCVPADYATIATDRPEGGAQTPI
jgi:quercetin dioxygenase-like cupin family protein